MFIFVLLIAAVNFIFATKEAFFAIGTGIIAVTGVLGYFVARLTLAPTRTALVAQKQFIGNIAHELRTPLSIIKTNTEVALLNADLDTALKKKLRSNVEELDRITDTINNLVSMSSFLRPEKVEFSATDLGAILDRILSALAPLAEHKNISIIVSQSPYRMVLGNSASLDQIICNILKNAIKYTSANGTVSIKIEPNYYGVIDFVVTDTGKGIRQKDLERIFEPFYRADTSRNREHGGSGLGLAIVSELVKLHRGRISIRSQLGRGTTVQVSLPCATPEQTATESLPQSDVGLIAVDYSIV